MKAHFHLTPLVWRKENGNIVGFQFRLHNRPLLLVPNTSGEAPMGRGQRPLPVHS